MPSPPAAISWWHSFQFPDGTSVKGSKDTLKEAADWQLNQSWFRGQRVLDVGAWDGFYSFLAERYEAKEVIALDSYVWDTLGRKEGFLHAGRKFNTRVRSVHCRVVDIEATVLGQFDRIIFAGVLYHMLDPFLALRKVVSVLRPGGEILVETHCEQSNDYPALKLFGRVMLGGDSGNFWGPNEKCVVEMLELVGCSVTKTLRLGSRLVVYAKLDRPASPRLRLDDNRR